MTSTELARIVDTWSDALNVAELIESRFLRVTERWDLHDWQTVEVDDGLRFQRLSPIGRVVEAVHVMNATGPTRRTQSVRDGMPTWLVYVEPEYAVT